MSTLGWPAKLSRSLKGVTMTILSKLTADEALRLRKFRNEYPEFAKQLDALTAELTDREGKYVDLLRTKHALEALLRPCVIAPASSRICEFGTHACNVRHTGSGLEPHVRYLAAEVERLKASLADEQKCGFSMSGELEALRDLVREADEHIDDLTTYGAAATVRNEKAWSEAVSKADAWQKKAKA